MPSRKASGGNHRSNMKAKSYKENVKVKKKMRKASVNVTCTHVYVLSFHRPATERRGCGLRPCLVGGCKSFDEREMML